jgi:hypothetical protein
MSKIASCPSALVHLSVIKEMQQHASGVYRVYRLDHDRRYAWIHQSVYTTDRTPALGPLGGAAQSNLTSCPASQAPVAIKPGGEFLFTDLRNVHWLQT